MPKDTDVAAARSATLEQSCCGPDAKDGPGSGQYANADLNQLQIARLWIGILQGRSPYTE